MPDSRGPSGQQLGVVLLEDLSEIVALARVQGLDQAVDARGHHEQVARRLGRGVPVGVGRPAPHEQRPAGGHRAFLVAHAKAQLALQHDPRLVVGTMHVQARYRAPGMRSGVRPVGDHEGLADDHGRSLGVSRRCASPRAPSRRIATPTRTEEARRMPVDNQLYDRLGDTWWGDEGTLSMLRTALNPARFPWLRRTLTRTLGREPQGLRTLDVGCGGGLLAEEFARLGCRVTGVDPAVPSLATARMHAAKSGLAIAYCVGTGERLPLAASSFDIAYCCDVLEHVADVEMVFAEI